MFNTGIPFQQIKMLYDDNQDEINRSGIKNFHVKGVNSFLLCKSEVLTLRLYIIDEDHELWDNEKLMIHNHGFDFVSQTLYGSVFNDVYNEYVDGDPYIEYEYQSKLKEGQLGLKFSRLVKLSRSQQSEQVNRGHQYDFFSQELHRIEVPKDTKAGILFWEFKAKDNFTPFVYSQHPIDVNNSPCSSPELYQRFEHDEATKKIGEALLLTSWWNG